MKVAIVTGASGNLGKAVEAKLLAEGFYVEASGAGNNGEKLNRTAIDLTNEKATADWVAQIIRQHTAIDMVVLTVGGFTMGSILETSSADILKQIHLNFETAYNVVRPVFQQMLKQKHGIIFLIGARPGYAMSNSKGMVAYGLSKSLLFRLAELLNEEAAETTFRSVVIVPSTIDTLQNRAAMPDADYSTWQSPASISEKIYLTANEQAIVDTVIYP